MKTIKTQAYNNVIKSAQHAQQWSGKEHIYKIPDLAPDELGFELGDKLASLIYQFMTKQGIKIQPGADPEMAVVDFNIYYDESGSFVPGKLTGHPDSQYPPESESNLKVTEVVLVAKNFRIDNPNWETILPAEFNGWFDGILDKRIK